MALRTILTSRDETLRKVSRPVDNFDKRLHTLLDDMIETLHSVGGAGLAAPQVGVLRRVCIVETEENDLLELVNPVVVSVDGEQTGVEACLSIPGETGIVSRPLKVTLRAADRFGKEFEITAEGFKARAFCHETDHLDGRLYVDVAERVMTDAEYEQYERERAERNET